LVNEEDINVETLEQFQKYDETEVSNTQKDETVKLERQQ
jgi:hypothetical protein